MHCAWRTSNVYDMLCFTHGRVQICPQRRLREGSTAWQLDDRRGVRFHVRINVQRDNPTTARLKIRLQQDRAAASVSVADRVSSGRALTWMRTCSQSQLLSPSMSPRLCRNWSNPSANCKSSNAHLHMDLAYCTRLGHRDVLDGHADAGFPKADAAPSLMLQGSPPADYLAREQLADRYSCCAEMR